MGILKNFLVSMVNRRTKAVIDIAKHNPVLEEQTKQLDKSIEKLENGRKKPGSQPPNFTPLLKKQIIMIIL